MYKFYIIVGVSCYVYSFWACSSITRKTLEESRQLNAELRRKLNMSDK